MSRDLRLAVRGLLRSPRFTFAATASLIAGLTLATTTASVINAYLIRSLPYPDADRLYHVRYAPPGPWEPWGMSRLDWASVADVVESPIAAAGEVFYFQGRDDTVTLRALRVSTGFVDGLGVTASAGRSLSGPDFLEGAERVALIGHALWRDRFGSDPGVPGRTIRVETESAAGRVETFRVAGVLQPGFYYGNNRDAVDLLLPSPSPLRAYMVKLREGVTPASAEPRLTEAARHAATAPIPDDWTGVRLESARERAVGSVRQVLVGVTVAVGLVLVIVCANVAMLLLLRSMQRQGEISVRLALGAGWTDIVRLALTEVTLICGVAVASAAGITALLLDRLAPVIETRLGRPAPAMSGITIDTSVLLSLFAAGLFTAILLSLAPLTSWGRAAAGVFWREARTTTDGRSMRRFRGALIASQVAGSLLLLIGCGLMTRSVMHQLAADLGGETAGIVTSRIMLRPANYGEGSPYRGFHEAFARRGSEEAGVPIVFSDWPPFVQRPGRLTEADAGSSTTAGATGVSAGYFGTFGIIVRQGRDFTPEEAWAGAPVAVVSESLARRLWTDATALGRRIREIEQTPAGPRAGPWRTVVGVASDVRQTYDDEEPADLYRAAPPAGRYATFYLRSPAGLSQLTNGLRRVAADIDRDAILSMPRFVSDDNHALAGSTFVMWVLTAFAAATTLLAMLGIYGVTAYAAQQRRKEMAIRVALGATGRGIVGIFVREGAVLLVLGGALGLGASAALTRLLQSYVFGVQTTDLATYAAASVLLAALGLATVARAAHHVAFADPAPALNGN